MKRLCLVIFALSGLAFIIVTPNVSLAAFDLFIQVEGVEGESDDSAHYKWIDGLSYSSEILSDGSGKSCFNDIKITKKLDKASPTLSLYAALSTSIPLVKIEFCRATGDKERFLEIRLESATVTTVSFGGSAAGEEAVPIEVVAFAFDRIQWTYTLFNPPGDVVEAVDNVTRCNGSAP